MSSDLYDQLDTMRRERDAALARVAELEAEDQGARAAIQGVRSHRMMLRDKVALWEAINRYVETCGGDPSGRVYGAISRQEAVGNVERAIATIEQRWADALRKAVEVEAPALERCMGCGCPLDRHDSHGRDDEAHECLDCECSEYMPDTRPNCPTCAKTPVGTAGVRDLDARCEMFSPGTPTNGGCQGDGHYLCSECMLLEVAP